VTDAEGPDGTDGAGAGAGSGEGRVDGPNGADAAADGFDPVEVFPGGDAGADLRPGADSCYKCTSCDTSCPVAEVDDEFPGPKFQGPEQWRLKRRGDAGAGIDDSITGCSNCMRCEDACPSGVPLARMHNVARAEYVAEEVSSLSREYVRDRLLANYGTLARVGSRFPRLTNLVAGSAAVRWIAERLLGITSEREFPAFAPETFREWYDRRGGEAASAERAAEARADRELAGDGGHPGDGSERKVAYFHGDYANVNTPEVAKALVRVFEAFGYRVAVPDQRCSGTPMFANGMMGDARRAARFNVETLRELVAEGYDVVCSCTSCSMALRREYPELFEFEGTADVAARTYEALEYLRIFEDLEGAVADADVEGEAAFAYHAPCHARNQGLGRQAVELFRDLDGVEIRDVGDSCSGVSGTYGWKAEKYDYSMEIGADMFEGMEAAPGGTGMTECPTCAMQMEHGTGYEIRHPLQLLERALG